MSIRSVLITGSNSVGGLNSFARDLAIGFQSLGFPVLVASPGSLIRRIRLLRDPNVLKILSTSAVFFAPICRNAICVSHGVPRVDAQGWIRFLGILVSLKVAACHTKIVAVSTYVSTHLTAIFNLRIDEVIYNPYSQPYDLNCVAEERRYLTYVGRLDKVKNIDKFIGALKLFLIKHPSYIVYIVGEGAERSNLEKLIGGHPSIFLLGTLSKDDVIGVLRRTKVFFSGCETEAFGITYLEALSCGCNIVLPLFGAGAEILMPLKFGQNIEFVGDLNNERSVYLAFEKAEIATNRYYDLSGFSPDVIARKYLNLGLRDGKV